MKERPSNKEAAGSLWNDIPRKKPTGNQTTNTRNGQLLRTVLWNTEGLNGAIQLVPYNFFHKYDIVILTETFLTSDWDTHGFYCINNPATQNNRGRPKGGITCLIKPSLSPFRTEYKSEHILLVRTKLCIIICAYFQPDLTAEDIIEEMDAAMSKASKTDTVLLAGDFNCRIDITSKKTSLVLGFLEEEGFHKNNKKESRGK